MGGRPEETRDLEKRFPLSTRIEVAAFEMLIGARDPLSPNRYGSLTV